MADWRKVHLELFEQGYLRYEYLTAAHNGENNFELFSKVSNLDVTNSVLLQTKIYGEIESIVDIYPAAKFHEEELQQMFGITLLGNLNIAKAFNIDFSGHPLRRDFALQTRQVTSWPGAVEPDEKARRRPSLPPGVFDTWQQPEQSAK